MKRIFVLICVVLIVGCGRNYKNEVVVYTSLDQHFSEPVLKDFENKTGIKVRVAYDIEATKTTGLVNRLIAEKANPQADVFWNSEVGRTIVLKKKGVLAPYFSPSAVDIPDQFKDRDGYWAGFAARARVLICNTDLLAKEQFPLSIFDLVDPLWKGKFCLAYPLFGTTATHAAALFVVLGKEKTEAFFRALKDNDVVIVDGNSTSRDWVVDGRLPLGFTDTDDVQVALEKKKPVAMIFPDKKGIGTLLIPNTAGLVANGPNPENGKKFLDYLYSREVESKLAFSGSLQMPLRDGVAKPKEVPDYTSIKAMKVDFEEVADAMDESGRFLQKLFVR
ncbi:extracellular solute-binding protein [Chlamydiota bacterium]